MRSVLPDTHAWAWSFCESSRLSAKARAAIEEAARVLVSPISFYEVAQKVRSGQWSEMEAYADDLLRLSESQGATTAALRPDIGLQAGLMVWSHRDPFDRLLAATALHYAVPIVSADPVFDGVISRIW